MNIATFLGHYQIAENPFRAEEARHDAVFSRVETACHHPDYEKIRGDFTRPATAIVFGERGSGKTAIRLQIEDELAAHNAAHPEQRCLPIIYDELNPMLDRFARSIGGGGKQYPNDALKQLRLVDHIDAMMASIVPRLVDQALGDARRGGDSGLTLNEEPARTFRQLDAQGKQDFITLQMCYDRPAAAATRTARLKRAMRFHSFNGSGMLKFLAAFMFLLSVACAGYLLFWKPTEQRWLWYAALALADGLTVLALGRLVWLWWQSSKAARDMARSLRTLDRSRESFRQSLRNVNINDLQRMGLPRSDDDDFRYAMFGRLLNVVRPFGYQNILVLIDRVDEPTMINGEPERMRALVWPLLNNKFLQQDRVGVKLLLPLDLRYLLNRETSEFFREARLDKQSLIERLVWSGAVLYDLCTARLNACRSPSLEGGGKGVGGTSVVSDARNDDRRADPPPSPLPSREGGRIALRDLFDDSVTSQDLVDALDQMQQPRDAFKFVYALIQEHCANVPEERAEFKIPRPVLDSIRKQQVERMSGMLRGVRPA